MRGPLISLLKIRTCAHRGRAKGTVCSSPALHPQEIVQSVKSSRLDLWNPKKRPGITVITSSLNAEYLVPAKFKLGFKNVGEIFIVDASVAAMKIDIYLLEAFHM